MFNLTAEKKEKEMKTSLYLFEEKKKKESFIYLQSTNTSLAHNINKVFFLLTYM